MSSPDALVRGKTRADSTSAKLSEEADEVHEKEKEDAKSADIREIEPEVLGKEPQNQKVITYDQMLENKKKKTPFEASTGTGELQQDISA